MRSTAQFPPEVHRTISARTSRGSRLEGLALGRGRHCVGVVLFDAKNLHSGTVAHASKIEQARLPLCRLFRALGVAPKRTCRYSRALEGTLGGLNGTLGYSGLFRSLPRHWIRHVRAVIAGIRRWLFAINRAWHGEAGGSGLALRCTRRASEIVPSASGACLSGA